jgi:uncharacterized protein (DUF433 family)
MALRANSAIPYYMNGRICLDPQVYHGKPVIRGTRVPVSRIVGSLAGGMSREEIMREYEIQPQDIDAALEYAAELIEHEQVFALGQ